MILKFLPEALGGFFHFCFVFVGFLVCFASFCFVFCFVLCVGGGGGCLRGVWFGFFFVVLLTVRAATLRSRRVILYLTPSQHTDTLPTSHSTCTLQGSQQNISFNSLIWFNRAQLGAVTVSPAEQADTPSYWATGAVDCKETSNRHICSPPSRTASLASW